ncbi:type VII secretion protein EccE [Mycolicibacterium conceptionense]|uniref:type VII secretion protein EccE n=1 Tax=Mycolicibacterium conceptionense TaxID=451644 RepID=UPI0032049D1F
MRERTWSARPDLRGVLCAEMTAALGVAVSAVTAGPLWIGGTVGALVGVLVFVVLIARLTPWNWFKRAVGRLRHKEHRLEFDITEPVEKAPARQQNENDSDAPPSGQDGARGEHQPEVPPPASVIDIDSDGQKLGLRVDGHTLVTMVSVWGKPYIPTLLRPQGSETPNTLPLSVISEQMQRFGLGVDVDVISEGRRTATDNYAQLYGTLLGDRPAAGQRTTLLVIRMDTRSPDTTAGLMWRTDTGAAIAAITRRITRALRQAGCRAEPMTSADMRRAVIDMHGGTREDVEAVFREGWKSLSHRGSYVTSYYFSAEDLTPERLSDVWAIKSDHTVLAMHLRRADAGITVSATVRFTTAQPQLAPPAVILNRYTGRQWWSLSALVPGADRITGMPTRPLSADLDTAVAIGPSGVMLGKIDDALMLMPLRDPAGMTRIVMDPDDDTAVRLLIRRAAASGEVVAVYDPRQRWTMAASSSRIWTTTDRRAQPPRPPTLVVHNGSSNPYPGAAVSVSVGVGPRSVKPDIRITERKGRITIDTERFTARVDAVLFRNEQTFLN